MRMSEGWQLVELSANQLSPCKRGWLGRVLQIKLSLFALEEKHLYADNFSPITTKELNKKEDWRKAREKNK